MDDNLRLVKDNLQAMKKIFNARVGVRFELDSNVINTLSAIERRVDDSAFKENLVIYNKLFTNTTGLSEKEITSSIIAFIKIKTLIECDSFDFNNKSVRVLHQNYNAQIKQIENVIKMSNTTLSISTDEIVKADAKANITFNEQLLQVLKGVLDELNKKLAEMPNIEEKEEPKPEVKENTKEKEKVARQTPSFINSISNMISSAIDKKNTEELLKEQEKASAKTYVKELACYEKSVLFSDCKECKDIKAFSLMFDKKRCYIGLSSNVKGKHYDNGDNSLYELTDVDETFIQFMTVDLLTGEYNLTPFTEEEKVSMKNYFNFMVTIFSSHLGKELSTKEYIDFQRYYNKLTQTMFELEDKFRTDYYRALKLADLYCSYMQCYDLLYEEDKNIIVTDIINLRGNTYIDDLKTLMGNYVVDESAKDALDNLIKRIEFFGDEQKFIDTKVIETEEEKTKPADREEAYQPEIGQNPVEPSAMGQMNPYMVNPYMINPYMMNPQMIPPQAINPLNPQMSGQVGNTRIMDKNDTMTKYNDDAIISIDDLSSVKVKIVCMNEQHVKTDEAVFAIENLMTASYDYLQCNSYIKQIVLVCENKDIVLYSSKNGGISVSVLDDETRQTKHLKGTREGELIEYYNDKIFNLLKELSNM